MNNQRIIDLHSIDTRYLRSAQLERDFHDPSALSGYCVTPETSKNLKRLSRSFRSESSQRAWRITGDFGSGKSSFALVLANLLSRTTKDLPTQIRPLRNDLDLPSNAPKLLPVLITGARESLSQAVLRALSSALSESADGRLKMPAMQQLQDLAKQPDVEDRVVVSSIEKTASELVEKTHFGGIVLIIDELGKFLEYAALHPEKQDVYFLQALSESATRSKTSPFTVIGLLHQGFAVYADKLSDSSQKEWEKVAGRFEEIVFNQPLNQVALLLFNALKVDENRIPRGWKTEVKDTMSEVVDLGLYGPDAAKTALQKLAPGLYPLHPTVLPILTKFFRRFGQNERSLFSFLLSSEPFALKDFSNQPATIYSIYRLSNFYDFAAQNFGHRLSSQSFRSHWNHIDAIIRSATEEPDTIQNILKTIGILNVVESNELIPTKELISIALGVPKDLDEDLTTLTKRGLLFNRGRRGYSLWPHTSVNLEQAYQEATESTPGTTPIAEVARARLDVRPVVARRHYIETGNLRHCTVQYMTVSEFVAACKNESLEHKHPADGLIILVLCESGDEQAEATKAAAKIAGNEQLLIAISPSLDVLNGISQDLERWHWIERHTPELKDDRFAATEVSRQIVTIAHVLDARLEDYIGFRKPQPSDSKYKITWYCDGKEITSLNRGEALQSFLSNHFDHLFPDAPKISNELINRQAISSAAAAARQQLFKRVLNNAGEPFLGLPEDKAPPEKSMYLSVLAASNIHIEAKEHWTLVVPEEGDDTDPLSVSPSLNQVISILDQQPDAKVRVDLIRDELRSPPYGVRDGLIPVFLSVALKIFDAELAVYEDGVFQPEIEENLMMRLSKRPETFEFQLCRLNGFRKDLLEEFAAILKSESATQSTLLSVVRPLCLFIDQLPDYSKQTENVSPEAIALRSAILSAKEPADLIFNTAPAALGFPKLDQNNTDVERLAASLKATITELRRAYTELQDRMVAFILKSSSIAASTIEEWRELHAETAESLVVEITDNDLRAFCIKLIDEHTPTPDWFESLGSFLTRCPPSRWRDKHEQEFVNKFRELYGKFNRVHSTHFEKGRKLSEDSIRLAITERSGLEHDRVIRLNRTEAKQVKALTGKVREVLAEHPELTEATLSKILWETLSNKS